MSAARELWIEAARAVRLESVLHQRGIALRGRGDQRAGPCPVCGGRDRFGVHLGKGDGLFHCRGCGAKGNGAISLVMFLDGCGFLDAVETLAGPPPDSNHRETDDERRAREQRIREARERSEREQHEREARQAADLRRTIRYCNELWARAQLLPSRAIGYFAGRRVHINDVPDHGGLRWHPAFPQWIDGPTRPSIIARFTDAITAKPGGIWHRPITGEKPKALGPMKGHVIRLWPDEAVTTGLVIGEGVETCMSAATRIIHYGTMLQPAWACTCRRNIADFPILPGIEHLTILADNDAKGDGQVDARKCAQRWAASGAEVTVLVPDELGADFNDIVRSAAP
jgi:phage/plasmid primase-like uncharacterized protein